MANDTAEERYQRLQREQTLKRQALHAAKRRLEAEGLSYPIYDGHEPMDQYYERLQKYSQTESAYMLEALKMPSGPRPVIEYKDWHDNDKD